MARSPVLVVAWVHCSPVNAPLRVIAELSGWSLDRVWRRFRLDSAPQPVEHAACVPAYDVRGALEFLGLPAEKIEAILVSAAASGPV